MEMMRDQLLSIAGEAFGLLWFDKNHNLADLLPIYSLFILKCNVQIRL